MFLDNKYTKWYISIIDNAKSRVNNGYVERHHIIPRSIGGTDNYENLVDLSAREHAICHILLTKMVIGNAKEKMIHAAWLMINTQHDGYKIKLTSKQYEKIRIEHSRTVSEMNRKRHEDPSFTEKMIDAAKKANEQYWTNERREEVKVRQRKYQLDKLSDSEFAKKHSITSREILTKCWESDEFRKAQYDSTWGNEEYIVKHREAMATVRLDSEYIERHSIGCKKSWENSDSKRRTKLSERSSSSWEITHPDGQIEIIKNLKKWCENRKFQYNSVTACIKKSYKGYKFKNLGKLQND